MKILLATRNAHKTREFAEQLRPEFQVLDLTGASDLPEIAETGNTFEENATGKALVISRLYPGQIVIADDSGLEVDGLGGRPGIFSARYAGPHARDAQNMEKLLQQLETAPPSARSARFRCAIAVCQNGKLLQVVSGEIAGKIAKSPRGKNGFGYDPLFIPAGFRRTFAELPSQLKNRISHRARAAKKLRQFLSDNYRVVGGAARI
ncbi:MAG: XTP/dITP diphosphohydrolase [Verrucomicrobiota bacterium]|jgi:XTP/dITP diphosphohydrolase